MPSAENLEALRAAYERALVDYEGIAASLHRHALRGTRPSDAELEREKSARAALDLARTRYLQAWLLP